MGLSLVLIHSEKGQQAFEELPLKTREVTLEQALIANKALIRSPGQPENRQEVLASLDTLPLQEVGKRYLRKLPTKEALRLALPQGLVQGLKRLLGR